MVAVLSNNQVEPLASCSQWVALRTPSYDVKAVPSPFPLLPLIFFRPVVSLNDFQELITPLCRPLGAVYLYLPLNIIGIKWSPLIFPLQVEEKGFVEGWFHTVNMHHYRFGACVCPSTALLHDTLTTAMAVTSVPATNHEPVPPPFLSSRSVHTFYTSLPSSISDK